MQPVLVYFELMTLAAKKYGPAMTWKELDSIGSCQIGYQFQHCGTKVTINWVTCILEKFKLHMHCLDAWVSYAIRQELIEATA